ncbi:helix-turn-helix domain-containing protein [Streptomyces sp. ID05-47C]|uniref:winged helix-turn-helix transcriptional regulator n=1 Tax=Streptomyces sp. ID05-47C TaxID=3028665 RepID=UPI0029A75298|nr:helix-turn-helix domain-containing protein [Streptomyces sp. ID05-47C]MDX3569631.1 helix-turn-helix domain-containing protein [Streptomyces sp. ID05-47C]
MTQRPPLPPDLFDELCPSSLLPFRFGDKWASMVLRCLEDGPRRYSELRVPLSRVTPKALTQSLRGLERNGFVSRTVYADPKLRVEYALTPLGRSTLEPLAAACQWATEHWDELLDAREGGISSIG